MIFDEHIFPFASLPTTLPPTESTEPSPSPILLPVPIHGGSINQTNNDVQQCVLPDVVAAEEHGASVLGSANSPVSAPAAPSSTPTGTAAPSEPVTVALDPQSSAATRVAVPMDIAPPVHNTRLRHGVVRPKKRTDGTVAYAAEVRGLDAAPTSYTQAAEDPMWRLAMDEKIAALQHNNTWHLVPPKPGLNIIGFLRLNVMLMARLSDTRLAWLLRVLNKGTALTTLILLVLL